MSDNITRRMLPLYEQMQSPTRFLTGLFQSGPRNFYSSEEVEFDIVRTEADVSVVIQDLSAGGRYNSLDQFTNKAFKAPIHREKAAINAFDMLNRVPGQNPFEDVNFQANATTKAMALAVAMEDKIRRSVELQASQVLQTGELDLIDSNGVTLFALDYQPKASHFPTSAVIWSNASADIIGDLESLADVINQDGLQAPDQLIMGDAAFAAFVQNDEIQKIFDNRRFELGTIVQPELRGNGGKYRGVVTIGGYNMDIWSYNGFFKNVATDVNTKYVTPGKVIMRASSGRLDATYGAIFNFRNQANVMLPALPARLSSTTGGTDLFTNTWLSDDGGQLMLSVAARPLLIPTAIDTFGCLDTGV